METKEFLETLPFVRLLGIEFGDVGDGYAEGHLEMREELSWNTSELMPHAGVTFTLAEATGAAAIAESNDPPVYTIDMRTDYVARAHGDLSARAEVIRDGSKIGVAEITVTDGRDSTVAKTTGVYSL